MAGEPVAGARRPGARLAVRRFLRHRAAVVGSLVIALLLVTSALAPWIAPHDPYTVKVSDRLKPPSAQHPLGTDALGRDVLSRILAGGRPSLAVSLATVALALLVGVPVGLIAGCLGGFVDNLLMRVMEVIMSVPGFLLALAVAALLGPSLTNAVIAICVFITPSYARVVRSAVLAVRESDFVGAAEALGASRVRIAFVHVLRNVVAPGLVLASLDIGRVLLTLAGLGFLGMGAQPPSPEWGALSAAGRDHLVDAWWISTFSGLFIAAAVLAFNLVGDGVQDAFPDAAPDGVR